MTLWDVAGDRSLRDLLEEQAQLRSSSVALEFEEADGTTTQLTYSELLAQVRSTAAGFAHLGIGRGDSVTVHLANSPDFVLTWFALAWLGAVMVPSNTANQAMELTHVIGYSDSVAVVTEPRYLELVKSVTTSIPALRSVIAARTAEVCEGAVLLHDLKETSDRPPHCRVSADDVQEMLFTSGTTAKPKGVLLTHANALRAGERYSRMLYLDQSDRLITSLPLFHVNAQAVSLLPALTLGGTCIVLEEFHASTYWRRVREARATVTSLVAMQARTLLAQPESESDTTHSLRRVFYAINISDAEKEAFESRFGVELINGYGLSEAMTVVCMAPVFGEKRWPSVGRPTIDRTVRLVDGDGRDVPTGTPGECIVQGIPGRTLMKGYYKDPKATAEALRDGWLHTGDQLVADEQGYFYFVDRKRDMIKRAGENISALEVESVILEHPDVLEVAVVGAADPIRDQAVKAFVVPRPGAALEPDDVIDFCSGRLAKFKVPTLVELIDALPRTSIGKVQKGILRERT